MSSKRDDDSVTNLLGKVPQRTVLRQSKAIGVGFLAIVSVLKLAATVVVWLVTPVYSVQGTTTGMTDDWLEQIQKAQTTATEPEPGLKALLWATMGLGVAADFSLATSVFGAKGLIGRFSNRHSAAALNWIALVAMAIAGDSIVHHVSSNVDAEVGPVTAVGLSLFTGMLGFVGVAEFWEHIQDE